MSPFKEFHKDYRQCENKKNKEIEHCVHIKRPNQVDDDIRFLEFIVYQQYFEGVPSLISHFKGTSAPKKMN